jgi:hypothetical protein
LLTTLNPVHTVTVGVKAVDKMKGFEGLEISSNLFLVYSEFCYILFPTCTLTIVRCRDTRQLVDRDSR